MTREETIKALSILKEQALKSHNDTAVIDVKKDSFVFVIQSAIEILETEACEHFDKEATKGD